MGRGGGGVGKADHKKKDKSGGGNVTVSVGKVNPLTSCIVFGVIGCIFLLLTIVVPVALVVNPSGDQCGLADTVNVGEQIFCKPDDISEDWTAEASAKGKDKIKVYRVKDEDIKSKTTTRRVKYNGYTTSLSDSYEDFSIYGTVETLIDLSVSCLGSKCDKVKMYWLTDYGFRKAFNSDGEFVEDSVEYYKKDFENPWVNPKTLLCKAGELNHLVFSNHKEKDVIISYTADITYTVYDVSDIEPEKCGHKCTFEDMKTGEDIILDYPGDGSSFQEPSVLIDTSIEARIHNEDINWSAVVACALIFGLITLVCFLIAAFYLYKFLKKVGKLGKKVAKKIEKEQEKQAAADAAAAQTYPAQDPYGGQAPYPGQPAYPGQM